jgi:hypothetical protein
VQTLFEEALKIRSAEEIEDIEMAWHSTAQRSLAGAGRPPAGADEADESAASMKTGALQDSTLSATSESLAVDPDLPASVVGPCQAEPATANQRQEGTVAKPEDSRLGSPRKEVNEAKVEKKEAKSAVGRGQKSLFDF